MLDADIERLAGLLAVREPGHDHRALVWEREAGFCYEVLPPAYRRKH